MGVEADHFEALHRLACRFVSDGLSFWEALDQAARLDPWSGIEAFKSSAIYRLERALAAVRAETRALRAEIQELERQLDPAAAEAEAFECEMANRLAREREAEEERRWTGTS